MNLTGWKEKIFELFNKWGDFLRNLWAKIFRRRKGVGYEELDQDAFGGDEADIGEIAEDGITGDTKGGRIPVLGNLSAALNGIIASFKNLFGRNSGSGPSTGPSALTKQRPLQWGLGGFIVLFLILLVTALAVNFSKPKTNTAPASAAALSIPSEELFIPAEPDFLPEFLLQREPRSYWSLEDIEPYWKTPSDSDLWREEIKSTVDKLMDGVP